jgi:hypothetical protein
MQAAHGPRLLGLEQEPRAAFRLVDPDLYQALTSQLRQRLAMRHESVSVMQGLRYV